MARELQQVINSTGRFPTDLNHWVQPIATVLGSPWQVTEKPVIPMSATPITPPESWYLPVSNHPMSVDRNTYSQVSFSASSEALEAYTAASTFIDTTLKMLRTCQDRHYRLSTEQIGEAIWDSLLSADRVSPLITTFVRRVDMGQKMRMMRASGHSMKRWVTVPSASLCERCRSLNGKIVSLEDPFHIDPRGGRYAVVYHPPLHPSCVCDFVDA